MAIIGYIRAEFQGHYLGQTCYHKIFWYLDEIPILNAEGASQALYNEMWFAWQPLVTDKFTLETITVRMGEVDTSIKQDFIKVVNEVGGIAAGEGLPAWVTAVLVKQPDNTTILPVDEPPFSNSRNGFSGITEIQQDDGFLTSAYLALWTALGTEMLTVVVDTKGWGLGIHRQATLLKPIPAYVYVDAVYAGQKLGSQLSRKY